DLIVVPAFVLQRVAFSSIFDEAEASIEPPRRFVAHHDTQLNQLDTQARKLDDRLDEPLRDAGPSRHRADIHAPEQALVRFLGSFANGKPGNAQNLRAAECAKDLAIAEAIKKPGERLAELGLECTSKSFRTAIEPLEPDPPVHCGICGR